MSPDRRQFLQHLTLGGVALSALPTALPALPTALPTAHSSGPDNAVATAALNEMRDAAQPSQQQFDVSWAQRLTGKYKAVFDTPEITGGSGVWRAGLWATHFRDVLGAQPEELSGVIVIRHAAMPLIMNQEFWETYDIAKRFKVMHPLTEKKTRRNPVLMNVETDALPPTFANYALDKQMERGVIVLGCNMAFSSMVAIVREKDKLDGAEARAKALSMMVPGAQLQPNGILAVILAQHHGCAFVAAS